MLAAKIADEATDYIILNCRFHRQLIGTGGENVRKLRDEFPNVQISIPGGEEKSDKITLRGPSKAWFFGFELAWLESSEFMCNHTLFL